jgi:disulfide bond formation protein DsbB
MDDHVEVANTFFTILTLLANAAVVIAIVLALLALASNRARQFAGGVVDAVGPSAPLMAWLVATVATLGSLYYSLIADFVPCELCWYQRICMYPLAVILLVGVLRREGAVRWYAAAFVIVGAPLSLYHWLVERVPAFAESSSCSVVAPCTAPYFEKLGFVTLAWMCMSSFLLIGTMLALSVAGQRHGGARVDAGLVGSVGDETMMHQDPVRQ